MLLEAVRPDAAAPQAPAARAVSTDAVATARGGYLTLKISHLNGRLFNRMLARDGRALYSSEQGKVMSALWVRHPQTATDLAIATGLANSTLTTMLRRLVAQGLVREVSAKGDRRKKHFDLTELGLQQRSVGDCVSHQLANVFYDGLTRDEIRTLDALLDRVSHNLERELGEHV